MSARCALTPCDTFCNVASPMMSLLENLCNVMTWTACHTATLCEMKMRVMFVVTMCQSVNRLRSYY